MYDNILKYVGASSDNGLSYEKQAKNYEIFSDLMKKGVDLQELVEKANAPKEPLMDESLFRAMENTVSDNKGVRSAKTDLDSMKDTILFRLCMTDPEYSRLYKEYKNEVIRAYTKKKDTLAKEISGVNQGD